MITFTITIEEHEGGRVRLAFETPPCAARQKEIDLGLKLKLALAEFGRKHSQQTVKDWNQSSDN